MDFLWTFLEGLASFVSPCTLPLMPVFAAYFAGDRGKGGLAKALAFVAGFTAVFMTLGLFAASVGTFFAAHRTAVSVVSGLVVIVFGLAFLEVVRLPGLHGADLGKYLSRTGALAPSGTATAATAETVRYDCLLAFAFGAIYSVNLSPCVGAFLAAALATAAQSGHALKGAALLGAYSAGLGIPFVVAGVALARLNGLFRRIKAMYRVLVPACGVALIAFGAWMVARPFVRMARAGEVEKVEGVGKGDAGATISQYKEGKPMEIKSKEMFEAEVLKSDKPVIVDFWAPWCGPCRAMGPVLEEIAAERPDLKVCKVNVDELDALAAQYMITSIPCIFCVKGGQVTARSLGLVGKGELLTALGL